MKNEDTNIYFLSIADAITGLMLIILLAFIAVYLQVNSTPILKEDYHKTETEIYSSKRQEIFDALMKEFSRDLSKWNARIDADTLAFILENSNNGFKSGSAEIPTQFENMLNQFVPRYINVIRPFISDIEEIRIEGHTSSEWGQELSACYNNLNEFCKQEKYIHNMRLSQDRAISVLIFILRMENIANNQDWIIKKLTAVGLSSSHLLCGHEKKSCLNMNSIDENKDASRRVEFSIRTNFENNKSLAVR